MHGTREQLGLALRAALKTRDSVAVSALRSALSAIANAEAVDTPGTRAGGSQFVAGAAAGLGGGEAPRRALSDADVDQIVRAEIGERLRAADGYDLAARPDQAGRLRREASVLTAQLPAS